MPDDKALRGELQAQIMPILWRLGAATVEQVRGMLPVRSRGAYTTVQTVLNRLAERGLLERSRHGRAIVYRPLVTEADWLSGTIETALAGSAPETRRAVLAKLVGDLEEDERSQLQSLAAEIATRRERGE